MKQGRAHTVEAVPAHRFIWICCVGLVRLALVGCLLVTGALWLCNVTNFAELLAGAVSLNYALQVLGLASEAQVLAPVSTLARAVGPGLLPHVRHCGSVAAAAAMVWRH